MRPLTITLGENQRHVLLYHYLHWHDHDVPHDGAPVLDLIKHIYDDRNLSPETPILVHCRFEIVEEKKSNKTIFELFCSAGCGRTGSFIAIDLCRLLINDSVRRIFPKQNSRFIRFLSRLCFRTKSIKFIPYLKLLHTFVNFALH